MIYFIIKKPYYCSRSKSAYFKMCGSVCRVHKYEYKFTSFCASRLDSRWRVCSRSYSRFKDGFFGFAYSNSLCNSGRHL